MMEEENVNGEGRYEEDGRRRTGKNEQDPADLGVVPRCGERAEQLAIWGGGCPLGQLLLRNAVFDLAKALLTSTLNKEL